MYYNIVTYIVFWSSETIDCRPMVLLTLENRFYEEYSNILFSDGVHEMHLLLKSHHIFLHHRDADEKKVNCSHQHNILH